MTVPGKLTVDPSGRIRGPANITYNDPWPCPNGSKGVTGKMNGVVLHTMDGFYQPSVDLFNTPGTPASAHFCIAQDGRICQMFPLGQGWEAFHAFAANATWYGIETEDKGRPHDPISGAAVAAWAQVLECLSGFAGFPLQVTDDCAGKGLAYHRMCRGWNLSGHTCPGATMTDMVRVNQRQAIVALAKQIRAGAVTPFPPGRHTADGTGTLAALALRQDCDVAAIWYETANAAEFGPLQAKYLNAGKWDARMPAGMILWLP